MKAEAALISAICTNKDLGPSLSKGVDRLFNTHSDVWEYLLQYWQRYGSVPDIDVLTEKFRDLHPVEVKGETQFYIDELRDSKLKMDLSKVVTRHSRELKGKASAEVLSQLISELTVLSRESGVVRDLDVTDAEDAVDTYKERKRLADERGGSVGIRLGLEDFDRDYPTGLAGGHMVVVMAWSGHGKSLFTTYMACKAWEQGFKPMIVSLEMSPEQVRDRIYTMLASGMFSNRAMTRGDINIDTFENWSKKRFEDKQGFIIVSNEGSQDVTVNTVQGKVDQYKPDLVIADYSQLFSDPNSGGSEVLRNRNVSRDFKLLAMRNDIPVVNITQATQSDKSDMNEPPLVSQVAWSKGLQHDADLILVVHKPPLSDIMEISAQKNRHGPVFGFDMEVDVDRGIWRVLSVDDSEDISDVATAAVLD